MCTGPECRAGNKWVHFNTQRHSCNVPFTVKRSVRAACSQRNLITIFRHFFKQFLPSKLTFTCKCVGVWMLNESAASTNRLHTRLETHTKGPRLCNPGQRLLFQQRWRPCYFFFWGSKKRRRPFGCV